MSKESFDGPLFHGQTRIAEFKSPITGLLFVLEICNVKPTYRKSWAANLLMWSDLTLGPLLTKLYLLSFSGGYILHLATDGPWTSFIRFL